MSSVEIKHPDIEIQRSSLTPSVGLAYALPVLSLYFLYGPLTILQGIYAKHFGLALTTIATVLLISRLFDGITDPVIGYYADRYYTRRGTRKPFIVAGGLLLIVASWFLFVPFDFSAMNAATTVSDTYFLGWFLLFYLAYTLFEIPHLAWGSELAADSREKNKVYAIRTFFVFLGSLLFYAMPLLPVFETTELTPQTLQWSVLVAGALMIPFLYLCIKTVPDTQALSVQLPRDDNIQYRSKKESLKLTLLSIFANKPLQILTAAHICTGIGAGMCFALLFIFVDAYLGLGPQFALVYVISFSISMVSLKLWYQLAGIWSKQMIWGAGMILVTIGLISIGVLSPGHTGWLSLLLCMTLIYSGLATFGIMLPSLLSDIIDYGTWKFGTDHAATYFSLYTFINKTVGALGGALGLAIAGWAGFDPSGTSHIDAAIVGLRLGVAWIPALMILLSIAFIMHIPITARRYTTIRRRLDARFARATNVAKTQKANNAAT